jgi:hypothetical protein
MEGTEMAEKTKKSNVSNVLFALIVIVFLAIVVGMISIDGILKSAIQTAIKKQLNVDASVSKVSLNIASGSVQISNLKISNPPGYQFERILETKSIVVKTSIGSLLSNPIEIKQITIDGIAVVIEQKGLSSNLNDILKSMPEKPKTETVQTRENAKSVHISSVDINDISVTAKLLPVPGKSDAVTLKISSLHLSDIGGKKSTLAENVSRIFTEIASAIAAKGKDILPGDMLGPIQENAAKSLESVSETGKQLGEEAKKEVEDTTKKLKGLFEKKKN